MTAHDPGLVERLIKASVDSYFLADEPSTEVAIAAILDLLAAEGRLCEPGEVQGVRGALREAVDDQIRINVQRGVNELRAERDRYREHSVTLNRIGWLLAVALGEVPDGADAEFVGDPLDIAERAAQRIVAALRAAGGQP